MVEINFEELAKVSGVTPEVFKGMYEASLEDVSLWTDDAEVRKSMATNKTISALQRKALSGAKTKNVIIVGYSEPRDFVALMKQSTDKKIVAKGKQWAIDNGFVNADGQYLDYSKGSRAGKLLEGSNISMTSAAIDLTDKKIINISANTKAQIDGLTNAINKIAIVEAVQSKTNDSNYFLNAIVEVKDAPKEEIDAKVAAVVNAFPTINDNTMFDFLNAGEARTVILESTLVDFTAMNKVGVTLQIPGKFEETVRIWLDYPEAADMIVRDAPTKVLITRAPTYNAERKVFTTNSNFIWVDPKFRTVVNKQPDVEGALVDE